MADAEIAVELEETDALEEAVALVAALIAVLEGRSVVGELDTEDDDTAPLITTKPGLDNSGLVGSYFGACSLNRRTYSPLIARLLSGIVIVHGYVPETVKLMLSEYVITDQ